MIGRLRDAALALWLLLAAVAVFVPFSPAMPFASLDAAWALGLAEASARGLAFGREMIFTYGPWSTVYTRGYHPDTYPLAVAGALYLGLSYAAALVLLMQLTRPRWNLVVLALLCGALWFLRDPVILSFPLVVAIVVSHKTGLRARWRLPAQLLLLVLLFAPMGLLLVVKGSIGILCLCMAVLCALYLALQRRPGLAAACVLTPLLSMLLFWRLSGQATADLPAYLLNMLPIVSGYTEAMSLMGDNRQALAYTLASAALLWALGADGRPWRETGSRRVFLVCAFGLFLFMSFKNAYIRHDLWRGLAGGTTLLVAVLLLRSASSRRRFWPVLLAVVLAFAYLDRKAFSTDGVLSSHTLVDSYTYAWHDWQARRLQPNVRQQQFSTAMAALKAGTPLLKLSGSVDLYPTDQGALIASGNTWNPRPILQSYSAYTPRLAQLNRDHLLDASAPDHLFFKVDAIDERLPPMADGLSWPVILDRYRPSAMQGDYLVLDRRVETTSPLPSGESSPKMTEQSLGEWVTVPTDGDAWRVEMDIRPTLYGRLAILLFKPSQLRIELEMADGTHRDYRMVSTMARSPFLLSPLVTDGHGFALLYGDPALLAGNTVRRFRVQPLLGLDRIWQHNFRVGFSPLTRPAPIDLSALLQVSRGFEPPTDMQVTMARHCDGGIDLLDRVAPARPPAVNAGSRWLSAAGWLAASAPSGAVPEESLLVFEDSRGARRFVATQTSPRPDVAAHFNQPSLALAGWHAQIDTAGLQGRYNLGLAYRIGRTISVCPEGRVQVDLGAAHGR